MMAQKMEHKNILRKVKCFALNVGEAMKRGSERTGREEARCMLCCVVPCLLLFACSDVRGQLILKGNCTADRTFLTGVSIKSDNPERYTALSRPDKGHLEHLRPGYQYPNIGVGNG
jgi:hypothetical protein